MKRVRTPQERSRAYLALSSLVVGLATAALPLLIGGIPVRAQVILGAAAMTALLAALAGWTPGITVAGLALGAEYALRLTRIDGLDGFVIVESAALLATVELALRSLDARSIATPEPRVRRLALVSMASLLASAIAAAFVVLELGSRQLPAPTAGLALGLTAAATLLGGAELLRRRATSSSGRV